MITTPPSSEADYLLRHYGHPELALEHCYWAVNNVEKEATKAWWRKVIEELKKGKA